MPLSETKANVGKWYGAPWRWELSPVAPAAADVVCSQAINVPLAVFLFGDATMVWHLLQNQLLMAFLALHALQRDQESFTFVLTGDYKWKRTNAFDHIFEIVSGSPLVKLAELGSDLCAGEAVLGLTAPMFADQPDDWDVLPCCACTSNELLQKRKPLHLLYKQWLRTRLGLSEQHAWGSGVLDNMYEHLDWTQTADCKRQPVPDLVERPGGVEVGRCVRLLIIDRHGSSRRWLNGEQLESVAKAMGFLVHREELEGDIHRQIRQIKAADIVLGNHGSGNTWPMYVLHPHAVLIEVQGYGHYRGGWTCGFANLARATNTSMMVWHNRDPDNAQESEDPGASEGDKAKNVHTRIPPDELRLILTAALDLLLTPVEARDDRDTVYLNEPVLIE